MFRRTLAVEKLGRNWRLGTGIVRRQRLVCKCSNRLRGMVVIVMLISYQYLSMYLQKKDEGQK